MAPADPSRTPTGTARFLIPLPRPRWIGVVAVLLLVASFGLHIGLPIYRQQAAISEIERLGGTIRTNYGSPDLPRCFDTVAAVDLSGTQATDDRLHLLGRFKDLEQLSLSSTWITDSGLEHLKGLSKLTYLGLENTPITDFGLHKLTELGLTGVTWLVVDDTQVTDAGIKHLSARADLQLLSLNNTQVTDEGLKHLADKTHLHSLYIAGSAVTDTGIEQLKLIPSLMHLDLARTKVTDEGLKHLSGLTLLYVIGRFKRYHSWALQKIPAEGLRGGYVKSGIL
jgi:Leucine-rich repeat (LRR) protein